MTQHIAVLGTGSDVGKSIVAAALCRSFADRGFRVAPFKSQNMSNNSGITPDGLEMGRAQIVQAEAARVVPHVDMNPILLKPTGEKHSQVVLNGRVHEDLTAMSYHLRKQFYFDQACQAYDRLTQQYDRIVLEGAGSCAEVNLMPSDIVNFSMAEYADARVVLVADIHRGGVFGQIVGTLACLPPQHRDRVIGFIINRFRGDINLFRDGVAWIEQKTGKKVLGVLPWYSHFKIDAEDSVEIEESYNFNTFDKKTPAIGVVRLPHIANFTDVHALSGIPGIQTVFFDSPVHLPKFSAVILPGSKNTRADLDWLNRRFKSDLGAYVQAGGNVLGICGGFQMLGQSVDDPDGLEGRPGSSRGLGLLPVQTVLKAPKTTTLSRFQWSGADGEGYEIHMGRTQVPHENRWLLVSSRNSVACTDSDGCILENRRVAGTYMHGFFDSQAILKKWLHMVGIDVKELPDDLLSSKEQGYEQLKVHFENHVDISGLV